MKLHELLDGLQVNHDQDNGFLDDELVVVVNGKPLKVTGFRVDKVEILELVVPGANP